MVKIEKRVHIETLSRRNGHLRASVIYFVPYMLVRSEESANAAGGEPEMDHEA